MQMIAASDIALVCIALWFAITWHINKKTAEINTRLDAVMVQFDGLRQYLYEIDPQFDDERKANENFYSEDGDLFAVGDCMAIENEKAEKGKRTLLTRFDNGF